MQKRLSRIEYQKQHRQEVIWQIWMPVVLGSFALLTLGVLAGFTLQSGSDSSARWAQISTMWLILPFFFIGILILLVLVGLIVGVTKLNQILPDYANIAQVYTQRVAAKVQNITLKSAQPIIILRGYKAAMDQFWSALQSLWAGSRQNNLPEEDNIL
jgi:hypothetical protein